MKNQLKTILLLGAISALLVGLGSTLGSGFTWAALAMALALNAGAYFFSDRLVLRMTRAREVAPGELPRLREMVDELAARAAIPRPRLFVIPDAQPNAFATGRNPSKGVVAVTEGILRLLPERELRGVIAHEIAHIRNRDVLLQTIAATMGAAIAWVANAVQLSALFGGSDEEGHGSLLWAFAAPLVATLLQLGVSRAREYQADRTGARISGDPEALASALERLHGAASLVPASAIAHPATASLFVVNPLAGAGGVMRIFSTHPPVEDRVRELRRMSGGWNRAA